MAANDGNNADRGGGGDWWATNAPSPANSWLPPGATLNSDGSVSLPGGKTMPAPPPGYTRDPNTGVVSYTGAGGAPMQPGVTGPPDSSGNYTPSPLWTAQGPSTTPTPTPGPPLPPGPPVPGPNIGVPLSGFGAAPTPYASDPNAPQYNPMSTYVAPTWTGGDYTNPTQADLEASPGYRARLDTKLQGQARQFAAQGTVLNGGSLVALDRTAQDYATNEYQTLRNNTYDAYVQKYKQFTDAAGMDLAARTVNANENQNTFANRTGTYNTGNARTLSDYITNVTNKRNSELDYWNRLNDVNNTGAGLAGGSR